MKPGDAIQINGIAHLVRTVRTPEAMARRLPALRELFEAAGEDGCSRVATVEDMRDKITVLIETPTGWETVDGQRPLIVMANPPPS